MEVLPSCREMREHCHPRLRRTTSQSTQRPTQTTASPHRCGPHRSPFARPPSPDMSGSYPGASQAITSLTFSGTFAVVRMSFTGRRGLAEKRTSSSWMLVDVSPQNATSNRKRRSDGARPCQRKHGLKRATEQAAQGWSNHLWQRRRRAGKPSSATGQGVRALGWGAVGRSACNAKGPPSAALDNTRGAMETRRTSENSEATVACPNHRHITRQAPCF